MIVCEKEKFIGTTEDLTAVTWKDNSVPKGIIHIVHGMTEHWGCYEKTAQKLLKQGYWVTCYNQVRDADENDDEESKKELYFPAGFEGLKNDFCLWFRIQKNRYPQYRHFVLGFSLGSFICRAAMQQNRIEADGYILAGTSNVSRSFLKIMQIISKMVIFKKSDTYSGKIVQQIGYLANQKIKKRKTEYFDWLGTEDMLKDYVFDNQCRKTLTASALSALYDGIEQAQKKSRKKMIPAKGFVLLIFGNGDVTTNLKQQLVISDTYEKLGYTTDYFITEDRHAVFQGKNTLSIIQKISFFCQKDH